MFNKELSLFRFYGKNMIVSSINNFRKEMYNNFSNYFTREESDVKEVAKCLKTGTEGEILTLIVLELQFRTKFFEIQGYEGGGKTLNALYGIKQLGICQCHSFFKKFL